MLSFDEVTGGVVLLILASREPGFPDERKEYIPGLLEKGNLGPPGTKGYLKRFSEQNWGGWPTMFYAKGGVFHWLRRSSFARRNLRETPVQAFAWAGQARE
jgi:hypothetical protein